MNLYVDGLQTLGSRHSFSQSSLGLPSHEVTDFSPPTSQRCHRIESPSNIIVELNLYHYDSTPVPCHRRFWVPTSPRYRWVGTSSCVRPSPGLRFCHILSSSSLVFLSLCCSRERDPITSHICDPSRELILVLDTPDTLRGYYFLRLQVSPLPPKSSGERMERDVSLSERTNTRLGMTRWSTTSVWQRKGRDASVWPKDTKCPKDNEEKRRDHKRKSIKPTLHQHISNKTKTHTTFRCSRCLKINW